MCPSIEHDSGQVKAQKALDNLADMHQNKPSFAARFFRWVDSIFCIHEDRNTFNSQRIYATCNKCGRETVGILVDEKRYRQRWTGYAGPISQEVGRLPAAGLADPTTGQG